MGVWMWMVGAAAWVGLAGLTGRRLRKLRRMAGVKMNDREFLLWLHDRFERVHDESGNMDYMRRLKAIAEKLPEEGASRPSGAEHLDAMLASGFCTGLSQTGRFRFDEGERTFLRRAGELLRAHADGLAERKGVV